MTTNEFAREVVWIAKAMIGVNKSATAEFTTAVNAVPITKPTAKSTTFPLLINALKSSKTVDTDLTPEKAPFFKTLTDLSRMLTTLVFGVFSLVLGELDIFLNFGLKTSIPKKDLVALIALGHISLQLKSKLDVMDVD